MLPFISASHLALSASSSGPSCSEPAADSPPADSSPPTAAASPLLGVPCCCACCGDVSCDLRRLWLAAVRPVPPSVLDGDSALLPASDSADGGGPAAAAAAASSSRSAAPFACLR